MHAQQLIQLAHLTAQKSSTLSVIDEDQLDGTLGQYWATAKCRIQRWQDELALLERRIRRGDSDEHPAFWARAAPFISELIFANVLTSVATATVLTVSESADDLAPIVVGVSESERDSRQRALTMLELACDRNLRQRRPIPQLSNLVTACEQSAAWTDLFLGYIDGSSKAARCGFVVERVKNNYSNCLALRQSGSIAKFQRRVSADIEQFFDNYPIKPSALGHLNSKIAHTLELAFGLRRQPAFIGE